MKRMIYLASVLVLAFSVISCQKSLQDELNPVKTGGVTVNVVADGNLVSDSSTKTAVVEDGTTTKFKWTEGDDITLYEYVDGEKNENKNSTSTAISSDEYSATFKVTLEKSDPEGSDYVYTACYPAGAFTSTSDYDRYQIPNTQTLAANGNFDPKADIMFGKAEQLSSRVTDTEKLGLKFKRLGSVVKLTLKGISSGEIINTISITAPEYIAGYCEINFMTGEVGNLAYSGQTNTIKLNANEFISDGEDVVWFRCIEGTWVKDSELEIVVDTDKAGYTRKITLPYDIVFTPGGLTKFSVGSLGDNREVKSTDVYSKVTSNLDDWSGEYLLVYENESVGHIWTGVDVANCYAESAISDNTISSLPTGAVTLTIAAMVGGYSIKVNGGTNDGKYIYGTSGSNKVNFGAMASLNTITYDEKNNAVSITSNTSVMRYNNAVGNNRFRYFKSSSYSDQQLVQLYKLEEAAHPKCKTPVITLDGANASISCATTGATIYYEIADSKPASFKNIYPGTPLSLKDGETIWAKATKEGYVDSEVSSKKYTAGGGSDEPVVLTFNLKSNPGGSWPTENSTTLTNYTYTLDDIDYTFALKNVKCNSGYLMLTYTAVLGLPTIEGYKLTKVEATNSGGCSTSTKVGISSSSSSASYISGGAIQTWSTTSSTYTYTLSGTSVNTMYYLYVTNKNAQITELKLTYE